MTERSGPAVPGGTEPSGPAVPGVPGGTEPSGPAVPGPPNRPGVPGPPNRPGVPTVLLVHGIRTSAAMWRRQVAALTVAGVPVLAPDLPGHGTRAEEPFTVDGALAALDDAARDVPGPLVVAGLSLGGYLALHWAARTPRRPAAVLAASCSTRPRALRGLPLVLYRALAWLIGRLPDGGTGFNDALARRFLPAEAVADVTAGGISVTVMGAVLAGMNGVDTLADLRAIRAPVWLVNGRLDHFRAEERRFLRACRHGRLRHVPGATHLVSLVAPVAFNRILLELVQEVTAGGTPPPHDPATGHSSR